MSATRTRTRTHLVHMSTHRPVRLAEQSQSSPHTRTHHSRTRQHASHTRLHTSAAHTSASHTSSHMVATHKVTPTTASVDLTGTNFSYPTPSNTPKASTTIMGLSITIAFLVIILAAVLAVLCVKRRRGKKTRKTSGDVGLQRIHDRTDSIDISPHRLHSPPNVHYSSHMAANKQEREKDYRTWYGKKIIAQVPANGFAPV